MVRECEWRTRWRRREIYWSAKWGSRCCGRRRRIVNFKSKIYVVTIIFVDGSPCSQQCIPDLCYSFSSCLVFCPLFWPVATRATTIKKNIHIWMKCFSSQMTRKCVGRARVQPQSETNFMFSPYFVDIERFENAFGGWAMLGRSRPHW